MNNQVLYPRYLFRKKLSLTWLRDYFPNFNNFLEIGAGRGDFTKDLLKNIDKGEIIDFSEKAAEKLKKEFSDKKISIILADFLKYDFVNKYSLIVMFEVLEHLRDDNLAFKIIYNLLEKDGLLIFSVPARMTKWGVRDEIAGHYQRYEKEDLIKKLKDNNFKIIKFVSYGFPLVNIITFARELLLRINYKKLNKSKNKEELTKDSGLESIEYFKFKKIINFLVKFLFSNLLMALYVKILMPFNKYNLGDGYLCLVKK